MRVRTTRFLSIAVVVAGTSLVLTANANAIPGPNTIPEVIAAVGSDTTYTVDNAAAGQQGRGEHRFRQLREPSPDADTGDVFPGAG
jgi:hypothetical protein